MHYPAMIEVVYAWYLYSWVYTQTSEGYVLELRLELWVLTTNDSQQLVEQELTKHLQTSSWETLRLIIYSYYL